jgi:hypothetical protein
MMSKSGMRAMVLLEIETRMVKELGMMERKVLCMGAVAASTSATFRYHLSAWVWDADAVLMFQSERRSWIPPGLV